MSSNGHIFFSISFLLCMQKLKIISEFSNRNLIYLLFGTLSGSLLPDIDHKSSKIGRLFIFFSSPISFLFGHRGLTHSFVGWAIFTILLNELYLKNQKVSYDFLQSFSLGYFSHLIADSLTPKGIPLFWPLKLFFKIPIFKSKLNKKQEFSISTILIIFSILINLIK